jgi:20S proteasome subunit beta 3
MVGKNCVAIASDLRFGINQQQTTAVDMRKIHKIHDHLYVGLSGLATDQMTLAQKFKFRHNLYELRENRKMKPETFANVVSNILYEKRFGPYYAEPVVAGLDPETGEPFITGMDLIGAMAPTTNFVVCGNNEESLFGVCESMYKEDLEPEELFEVIAQCLLAGVNRDCLLQGQAHHAYPQGAHGLIRRSCDSRVRRFGEVPLS